MKSRTIRDIDAGTSAAVLEGERAAVSPIMIEQLIAEAPSDQAQTLPVGALAAWKQRIREDLLEELDAAGRLRPEAARRMVQTRGGERPAYDGERELDAVEGLIAHEVTEVMMQATIARASDFRSTAPMSSIAKACTEAARLMLHAFSESEEGLARRRS